MNAVTTAKDNALPAHLQQGKQASFGNIDSNDLIIPRVKLLQSTSPEVEAFTERGARTGQFWHTLSEEAMGNSLKIVPLILKKELVLWAPRGDDRGVLARSSDCIHWDDGFANLEFEVKLKGVKEPVKYKTMGTVAESGLDRFGSAIPGDPNSRPAASITYRMMFFFLDHPEASPAIVINTRSSVKAAKGLISKIEMKPVDHYYQVYTMGVTDEVGDEGPYKGYSYTSSGYVEDPDLAAKMKAVYDKFRELDWKANEESDDTEKTGGSGSAGAGRVGGEAKADDGGKF